ncbi:MAG: hypothetical protein LBD48_03745 [Treponema sp.]|nr:hypothetical protein [Treponema sp.]
MKKKSIFIVIILIVDILGAQSTDQENKFIVNDQSKFEIESAMIITPDSEKWFIGKTVKEEANTQIISTLFGVPFGPIDGLYNNHIKIGWNNRNRILYIEVLSSEVKTQDGIVIGDTKERVLSILGIPYIEKINEYRYQNIDFELIGIIFQFCGNRVSKIIVFS